MFSAVVTSLSATGSSTRKPALGHRNSQVVSTKGAVSAGMSQWVSRLISAIITIVETAAEDDVDGQQDVEFEEEGQGDPDQNAVEAEQTGPEQGAVGAQQVGGQGAGGQAEQGGPAELERVDEDADEKQQAGEGVVLEHHLADTAQERVDHRHCWIALGHSGPAVCRAPWRARDCHDASLSSRVRANDVDRHGAARRPGVASRASGGAASR